MLNPPQGYATERVSFDSDGPAIAGVLYRRANLPDLDLSIRGTIGRYVPPHMRLSKRQIAMATIRLLAVASADAARGRIGLSPLYIPVYGRLGHAVFSDPALKELFRNVEQNTPSWRKSGDAPIFSPHRATVTGLWSASRLR